MASAAVQMTGTVLGKYPIRISPSKSAIQNAAPRPNYSNEQLDQISRTIHVGNLDVQVTDSYIRAIFERSSGPIARIALAGETSYTSRFAFIEFFSRECAQDALKMNGVIVAGKQIRVNMSRSPIMTNTGPPPHGYNRPYQQDYYNQSYSPDEYHSPYRGPSYPPSTSSTYDQHSEPIPQDNRDQQDHHNVTELSHTSHQNNNQRAKNDLSPPPQSLETSSHDLHSQSFNDTQEEDSEEEESDSGSEGDTSDEESDSDEEDSDEEDEDGKRKRNKKSSAGPDKKRIKTA